MTFDQAQADSFNNSRYGHGRVIIYSIIAVLMLIDFYAFAYNSFGNLTSNGLFFHWAIIGSCVAFIFCSSVDCLIVREKSAAIIFNALFACIMALYLNFGVLPYMNNISLYEVIGSSGANSFHTINKVIIWLMIGLAIINLILFLFAKKPEEQKEE